MGYLQETGKVDVEGGGCVRRGIPIYARCMRDVRGDIAQIEPDIRGDVLR